MIILTIIYRAFFSIMILLNTILLACTGFSESDKSRFITQAGNTVFSGIFTVEGDHNIKKTNIMLITLIILLSYFKNSRPWLELFS
jgi:hypothetical protein